VAAVTVLVLDAQALWLLAQTQRGKQPGAAHAALTAARDAGADIVVPAAVLAELYRGHGHDQAVDAYLNRRTGIMVADTTRQLARRVGHLLASAGRGSADHVDATVVAVAITAGGGVIATGDPDDITALVGDEPGVGIVRV